MHGKLAVAKEELEISRKLGATLDALYKIKNQVPEKEEVAHHISSFQDSLLDILLYTDDQFAEKSQGKVIEPLTLERHFYVVIDRRLLLCWTFTNDNERTFCYPTVKIFIDDQHINCVQKVFVHKSSTFSIDDECREIIYSTEKFSLLLSLEMPRFHLYSIHIDAILCGFIGQSIDYILPLEETNFNHHQQLLRTIVFFLDRVSEEHKDISTFEDLACLKVTQQRTVFRISCFSDMRNLEKYLLSKAEQMRTSLLLETATKKILIFKSALSPFYGVSITFQAVEDELEIETFTRNDQETFLIVQYLYECLPQDAIILPCGLTANEQSELKKQVVCAMKGEIDLLLTGIHINAVHQSNHPDSNLISRKQFFKIRNSVSRKEAITDYLLQSLYQINLLSTSKNDLK